MKYVAPVAELFNVEAVSVVLASEAPVVCNPDCESKLPEVEEE